MPTVPISITIPQELLEQIKKEVGKGSYASVSEFVRDAVRDRFEAKDAQFNRESPGGLSQPTVDLNSPNLANHVVSTNPAQVATGDGRMAESFRSTASVDMTPPHSSRSISPAVLAEQRVPQSTAPFDGAHSRQSPADQLHPSAPHLMNPTDSPPSKSPPPPVVIFNIGENSWIMGKVERGQQLGGKLGFPTLNLDPSLLSADVPHGVFVAEVEVADTIYQAAGHYGPRKTLDEWRPTLEFHLLDFDQHIPGHLVRFRLLKQIRETMKFAGLEHLKKQLADDVAAVRRYFEEKLTTQQSVK